MKNKDKTKEQLLNELAELHQQITELKSLETDLKDAAKTALLNEKSKSEKILAAIGEGISIQATNFRILYQNQKHKDLVGDHVGEYCYKAYRQREDVCEDCPLDISFKGGKIYKTERSLTTDKGTAYIAVTASPLRNAEGEIIAGIEVVRDITKRKEAEEALQAAMTKAEEEKSKSEAILAAIGDAISIQDTDFKILYQNQIQKNITGDHIGEHCYMAYHQKDHVCEDCPIAMTFKDGKIHTMEKSAIPGAGMVYVEITTSPLRDATEEIIAGIEVIRDVTERKKAEQVLKESEEKYRMLIENIQDGVFIIQDAKIKFINEAFANMVGYTGEEVIGMDVQKLIAPEDLDMVIDRYRRRLAGEDVPREYEFKALHKDGVTRVFVNMLVGLVNYQGRIASMGTVKDITEHKKMEAELLKAQKLESLGILAGGIAHNFNNILTAITGNISLAKMYAKPGLEVFDILTEVEKASHRAKNLTQQLLTFSKGGMPVRKITAITRLIKDSASFALSGSNVRYEISAPDNIWPVEVDEGQISLVINNLIINALQAMPEGGVIMVSTENITVGTGNSLSLKDGKYVRVSIKDQGHGIAEEHRSKIFDPYFTTKQEGSGLGLATAYSIIKRHDGNIAVESKLGAGTIFHLYLPAAEEKITIMKDIGGISPAGKGRGKILVMDDDEIVRVVVGRMLAQCGYEADFAEDGDKAVDIYKKGMESGQPFDAVIIDLIIPAGMGGKEAIKKLLEIDHDIKAIVSSGYSDDPVVANFKEYGFRGALAKPYEIAELRQMLHRVITGE